MYDSTNVDDIPKDAAAVIGYVGGDPHYTQYAVAKKRFPKAHVLGLAVASKYDAEGVDVEKGDVPNELVTGWVKRQIARGVKRPVVYTSASNVSTITKLLAAHGVPRNQVRILSAHYNYKPHICGPKTCGYPQADGTQWTNKSGGRHLDESLLSDTFFAKPKPEFPPLKHFPKPPSPMPAWWWEWADWRRQADLWRRPMGPRPASTPRRIPLWAWGSLIAYNKKHPPLT